MKVRPPAVAGLFYPADRDTLAAAVDELLAAAPEPSGVAPKALVAPHAGYIYSGPIAATAYASVRARKQEIRRVVILGPAHRVAFEGVALPSVDAFRTPLGDVRVDREGRGTLALPPAVVVDDRPHEQEHAIEVQLPFLQRLLTSFTIVPMIVGRASDADVAAIVDAAWGGDETLVVVSSDLSHYETYRDAAGHDRRTAAAILTRDCEAIGPYDACGAGPLRGLLASESSRELLVDALDLRSSGDTAGAHDRVVGYGAFALSEAQA